MRRKGGSSAAGAAPRAAIIADMRLTEFHRLVAGEFGNDSAEWVLHSHVLAQHGKTANELVQEGLDPREVWWGLCEDFEVPEERRYGADD